jgi:hypothetical protein
MTSMLTKRTLAWALFLALAVGFTIFLTACARGSVQADPTGAGSHAGPSGVLARVAVIASALAGSLLVACAFLAVFWPDKTKVAKLAVACVTILIGAQAVYWLGQHLVLATGIVALVLLLGGFVYLWVHRRSIETSIGADLDRDGKIG